MVQGQGVLINGRVEDQVEEVIRAPAALRLVAEQERLELADALGRLVTDFPLRPVDMQDERLRGMNLR